MVRSHYPDVRINKEAETLLSDGHNVIFLAWDRRNIYDTDRSIYEVRTLKLPVRAGSIKVAFFLPVWWLYLIYQMTFLNFDIVHAADFDTYVPALLISKIKRKKIIYDIFDYYAETIVFPVFPKISKFLFSKIDDFLMKFANAIIIADESRIKQIRNNANKHIIVINNSPLDKNFHEINFELQNEKLVIFFGGVVQEDKGITNMILAVKDLQNVDLIIQGYCGSKDFENKIYLMCQDLPQVKLYLKRVPYEDILKNTMKADLLFTLYDTKISNNIFASPNKLFEAMMFGKPIIVNEGTTMESIIKKFNCGLVVRYDNIDQIKEAIVKLKLDYSLRKKLGENGRKAYETIYSWEIMKKRLLQLYKLIAN